MRFARCSVFLIAAILALTPAFAQTYVKELAQGIILTQTIIQAENGGPQIINAVTLDPKAPGVKVQAVLSQDRVYGDDPANGRETVSSMARRLNAVAVINADFFPMTGMLSGDPTNLHVCAGEIMSEPNPRRVVFGLTSDGKILLDILEMDARITAPKKWFPIRGVNRLREHHQLMVYTPSYFTSTCTTDGGSEAVIKLAEPLTAGRPVSGIVTELRKEAGNTHIPEDGIVVSGVGMAGSFIDLHLEPGAEVTIEFTLKPPGWEKVMEAVGGGSYLVKGGKAFVDADAQGFGASFSESRHPRTAVGRTADGKLVLVTVDGRQNISLGMSLKDLAEVMIRHNCVEAANLDGGGSTTLAGAWGIINSPSSGIERQVSNGVAVFGKISESEEEFTVSGPSQPVESGKTAQFLLLDSEGKPLSDELMGKVVWGSTGYAGFVDQSGKFYAFKARKGKVTARIGSKVAEADVETIPGPPARLTATFQAEGDARNRSVLAITLTDENGNGIEAAVGVSIERGVPDIAKLFTDKAGKGSTGVTWDNSGGEAVLTCGGLAPVTVKRP